MQTLSRIVTIVLLVFAAVPTAAAVAHARVPDVAAPPITLASVSCPNPHVCVAVGYSGDELRHGKTSVFSTDGGVHWTRGSLTSTLHAVTCPSARVCIAVGGGTQISVNGGASWADPGYSYALNGSTLLGISCPSTHHCVTVGSDNAIATSEDGGAHWTKRLWSTGSTYRYDVAGVSCPTTQACVAVGDNAVMLTSTTSGASWTARPWIAHVTPSDNQPLTAVSCPSARVCVATGGPDILASADGGASWSKHDGGLSFPTGVSCPSTRVCMAVSNLGQISTSADGGASWTSQFISRPIDGPKSIKIYGFHGVTCSSAARCVVVGDDSTILTTADGGAHWTYQTNNITG